MDLFLLHVISHADQISVHVTVTPWLLIILVYFVIVQLELLWFGFHLSRLKLLLFLVVLEVGHYIFQEGAHSNK